MTVFMSYYHSPIGIIEIKAINDFITSVSFVHQSSTLKKSSPVIDETIKQLNEYFSGVRKYFEIPLVINGTDFQKSAWQALTKIPYGETRSYKEQALSIGNEKAVRAIGQANNRNPIAIIVPCHRVIGANKKLIGYGGGLDKKAWLLSHETSFINR